MTTATRGRLQDVIAEYRARLLAHEQQSTKALEQAYHHTMLAIQPKIDKLLADYAAALDSGKDLSPSWLYEANRMSSLSKLIEREVNTFGQLAQTQTGELQRVLATLGKNAALDQLETTVPVGVKWSFGAPSQEAIANIVGATQAGPLANLFSGFGAEAAQLAKTALTNGIMLGNNPRVVARDLQQELGTSRARALTIARNEMLRAYRGGSQETMRTNSDVCKQWQWSCAFSDRSCAACLALDGTIHSLDEDMASHVNCRCSPIPITRDWQDILSDAGVDTSGLDIPDSQPDRETGTDWFNRQSPNVQRAILGNAKYQAFAEGKFTLSDTVGHTYSADWGHSIREKSLKELINGRN